MKIEKVYGLLIFVILTYSCVNTKENELGISIKKYGLLKGESDSTSIELEIHKYGTWRNLLNRTEQIACNDSIPKITLKNNKNLKAVYFRNPCSEDFGCILIKQKNIIEIHNDTINKSDEYFYPLDSLKNVLKRDFYNNGKNPELSDNPKKLLINISYDELEPEKLTHTLDKLTKAYEEITNRTDIIIWLKEKYFWPPPPPPPKEPERIELITEE